MKLFFWNDKSGRGFSATQTDKDLLEWQSASADELTDWNNKPLTEFVTESEVGDTWENEVHEITRTK